jgi:DNA repair exonuclease SbcCD ATPase subunit
MNEERSELNELQKEWRGGVANALDELRKQGNAIQASLYEMKQNYATVSDIKRIKDDIEQNSSDIAVLQNDKAKLIGFLIALQLIGGAVLGIILKLIN